MRKKDRARRAAEAVLMTMRTLVLALSLGALCAACSSVPTPCRPQASGEGSGGNISAEARVTWKSGGCSSHTQ